MPAIDYQKFAPLLRQFSGKRFGFFEAAQDIGSKTLYHAIKQLCYRFNVKHTTLGHHLLDDPEHLKQFDYLAVTGLRYPAVDTETHIKLQSKLIASSTAANVPLLLFPQLITEYDQHLKHYAQIYQIEGADLNKEVKPQTYPSLLLGFETRNYDAYPRHELGVFLCQQDYPLSEFSLGDPHKMAHSPFAYYELASQFQNIITDRHDFAVMALCANRAVELVGDSQEINEKIYPSLQALGCEWLDIENSPSNYDQLTADTLHAKNGLWEKLIQTNVKPVPLHRPFSVGEQASIDQTGIDTQDARIDLNSSALMITKELAVGQSPIEITDKLAEEYAVDKLTIGQAVYNTSAELIQHSIIKPQWPVQNDTKPCIEINVNEAKVFGHTIVISADILTSDTAGRTLWFAVPKHASNHININNADAFVLALFWNAMCAGQNLIVKNRPITDTLLNNLNQYQQVWHEWLPTVVKPIEIIAGHSSSPTPSSENQLVAFSGGVDSSYSLMKLHNEHKRELLAITAHGFDIPVSEQSAFNKVSTQINAGLGKYKIQHACVQTNLRSFSPKWDYSHGAAVAAILNLFSDFANKGVIASTFPSALTNKWGSNHQTDPLLSGSVGIEHHGDDTSRFDKIQSLTRHPNMIRQLHVCWSIHDYSRNCGNCQKCVLLQLSLRILEQPLDCFERPLSEKQLIDHIPRSYPGHLDLNDMRDMDRYTQKNTINTPLANALSDALKQIDSSTEWRIV